MIIHSGRYSGPLIVHSGRYSREVGLHLTSGQTSVGDGIIHAFNNEGRRLLELAPCPLGCYDLGATLRDRSSLCGRCLLPQSLCLRLELFGDDPSLGGAAEGVKRVMHLELGHSCPLVRRVPRLVP